MAAAAGFQNSEAMPARNFATQIHVAKKGVHYTVTWKGTAAAWKVTLKVGKKTATITVKGHGYGHGRGLPLRNDRRLHRTR